MPDVNDRSFAHVWLAGRQNQKLAYVRAYRGQAEHEVSFSEKERAKRWQPSVAQSVAGYIRDARTAWRPVPQDWSSAIAIWPDGTPLPDQPEVPTYVEPKQPGAPELPEHPKVFQLTEIRDAKNNIVRPARWVAVPTPQLKSAGWTYAYAWIDDKGEPRSGYFSGKTKKELFESVFNSVEWNPQDPNSRVTLEGEFRNRLPDANEADVTEHLATVAKREAYFTEREAFLNRIPTEEEIAAVGISPELIERMPAQVLKDRILSDPAFRAAFERQELALRKIREKEFAEAEAAGKLQQAREARERLERREQGLEPLR